MKADLKISFNTAITETFNNKEFLKLYKIFYITATEQDINQFVAIDYESSHLLHEEILQEEKLLFEETQAVNEDENITSDNNDPMDVDATSQRLQSNSTLDNVYLKYVIM